MPPFIRVETENTSPEYRLEARRRPSDAADEALAPPPGSYEGSSGSYLEPERRIPPPPHRRSMDGRGRGGRRGGRFNDRLPRGSPRVPRPDRRDFPRDGPTSPRFSNNSYDAPPQEELGTPTGSDRSAQLAEAQSSPGGGAGQKRGYTDAFEPNNNAPRGYNLDSSAPAPSRQRLD